MPLLPEGYLSIGDAAHILGSTPGDVVQLINTGDLETVELIHVDSLEKYRKASA